MEPQYDHCRSRPRPTRDGVRPGLAGIPSGPAPTGSCAHGGDLSGSARAGRTLAARPADGQPLARRDASRVGVEGRSRSGPAPARRSPKAHRGHGIAATCATVAPPRWRHRPRSVFIPGRVDAQRRPRRTSTRPRSSTGNGCAPGAANWSQAVRIPRADQATVAVNGRTEQQPQRVAGSVGEDGVAGRHSGQRRHRGAIQTSEHRRGGL